MGFLPRLVVVPQVVVAPPQVWEDVPNLLFVVTWLGWGGLTRFLKAGELVGTGLTHSGDLGYLHIPLGCPSDWHMEQEYICLEVLALFASVTKVMSLIIDIHPLRAFWSVVASAMKTFHAGCPSSPVPMSSLLTSSNRLTQMEA